VRLQDIQVHLIDEESCGKPQGISQTISIASNHLSVYLVFLCVSAMHNDTLSLPHSLSLSP
jgi:hypothetical protein